MKFNLHIGRSSSLRSSNAEAHKQRAADNPGNQWSPSNLVAPPPYSSVVPPEIHINGAQRTSRPSAAPGSSSLSQTNRLRDIAYLRAPMRRESKENALEMLRTYDTVVVMDDSGSMIKDDRWEQACQALSELAQVAASYDRDGIDIHFLNHSKCGLNVKDTRSVRHLFRHVLPRGPTPIAHKLDLLVGDYVEKLEGAARKKRKGDPAALKQMKPVNFIVITDGAPTDDPVDSIVALARRLDRGNFPLAQVGIQFVQIGDDKEATEFLKQMDDDLSGNYGVRDIVDTTPFLGLNLTAEMLIKILLGGINRRVDRHGAEAVMSV